MTALAQALLYMTEFDWNPQDAVNVPKIHHQWMPDVLYLERGFAADVTRALAARGHRLESKPSLTDMNAIVRRGDLRLRLEPAAARKTGAPRNVFRS